MMMSPTTWVMLILSLQTDLVHNQRHDRMNKTPEFDDHLPSNITVQQGDTAYLHCKIFNAENM